MIDELELRDLLSAVSATGVSPTTSFDEEFVLDSLGLTWLVHAMSDQRGLTLDLDEPRLSGVTTIRRLVGYLRDLSGEPQ